MAGSGPDTREIIDRVIVSEFNRQQASVLLHECIVRLTDANWDHEWIKSALLDQLRNVPRRNRDKKMKLYLSRAIARDDARCLASARRYASYEKRFRGTRDRGLRMLAKIADGARVMQADQHGGTSEGNCDLSAPSA